MERSITTSMSACGTSCDTATRWLRAAVPDSRTRLCSGIWACCDCAMFTWGRVREPLVKSVGKPDARNGHVRFDERGRETGRPAVWLLGTAPFLDSTGTCRLHACKMHAETRSAVHREARAWRIGQSLESKG